MGTSGNGVKIIGMATTKAHLAMAVHGSMQMLKKRLKGFCAAAPGAPILGIVAPPLASTMMRGFATTTTSSTVFVLFDLRPGLRSP